MRGPNGLLWISLHVIPLSMSIPFLTNLDFDQQRRLGVTTPCPVAIADKVRFSELDNQNHVNNKAYVDWFERARTEHYYNHVAPFWSGPAPYVALHTATIRYHKQMLANETYVVTSRTIAFRNTSYTVLQEIISGDLRASMEAIVVMLEPTPGSTAKVALPDDLKQAFRDEGAQG